MTEWSPTGTLLGPAFSHKDWTQLKLFPGMEHASLLRQSLIYTSEKVYKSRLFLLSLSSRRLSDT